MDRVEGLENERAKEKRTLNNAVNGIAVQMAASKLVREFCYEMQGRLYQKVDEGYAGWAEADWDIAGRIEVELSKLRTASTPEERQRRAVDLANFALMEWHRAGGK